MKYTVVLLRPEYLSEREDFRDKPGQDIYVAIGVEASEVMFAVRKAKAEVFEADKKDKMNPDSASDYTLVVAFEGTHQPKLFGWQAH